jgi:hypothetical protein
MICPQIAILVLIAANCVQGQVSTKDQEEILSKHNTIRANVNPTAADMTEMVNNLHHAVFLLISYYLCQIIHCFSLIILTALF